MTATANACGNAVDIQPATASGVNSTAVSAPTVFNYPRPAPRDDGRLMAVASLIGSLFDALLGGDGIGEAGDAESKWKDILDNHMKTRGESELQRVDSERAKLADFETDLKAQLTDYRNKADAIWPDLQPHDTIIDAERDEHRTKSDEWYGDLQAHDTILDGEVVEHATKSDDEFALSNATCMQDAFDKLCEFVACGYTPDYNGIATRARADAEKAFATAYETACRSGNRYNVRRMQSRLTDIRLGVAAATVSATAEAREAERQFMWKTNHEWRFQHADFLEKTRLGRRQLSAKYDDTRIGITKGQFDDKFKMSFEFDQSAIKMTMERWSSLAKLYLDMEHKADALSSDQWRMFNENGYRSLREGGEMLAAAAQAYQFLAASIRATAKQGGGGGGIAGMLATLAVVFPMFNGSCNPTQIPLLGTFFSRPQECCGGPCDPDGTKQAACTGASWSWDPVRCTCVTTPGF